MALYGNSQLTISWGGCPAVNWTERATVEKKMKPKLPAFP